MPQNPGEPTRPTPPVEAPSQTDPSTAPSSPGTSPTSAALWLSADQLASFAEDAAPTPAHLRPDVVYGTVRVGGDDPAGSDTYVPFVVLPGEHRVVPLRAVAERRERIGWYDSENRILLSHTPFSWDWKGGNPVWLTVWNVGDATKPIEVRRLKLTRPPTSVLQYDHVYAEVVVEERLEDTGEHERYTEGIMRKALKRDGRVRWQHDTTEDTEVYALYPRFGRLGFTVIGHRLSTASPFHKGRFEQAVSTALSPVELGAWRPVPDASFRTEDYAQDNGWSLLSVNPDATIALGIPATADANAQSLLRISLTSSQKPFAATVDGVEGVLWSDTFKARLLRMRLAEDGSQRYAFEPVTVGNTNWTRAGEASVLQLPVSAELPATRFVTSQANILCVARQDSTHQFFYVTFKNNEPRFTAFAVDLREALSLQQSGDIHATYATGGLGNWLRGTKAGGK